MPTGFHRNLHIAVCDDEPQMAEQNEAALSRILDGHGLQRSRDY